jgi:HEXXH motif-containing protein
MSSLALAEPGASPVGALLGRYLAATARAFLDGAARRGGEHAQVARAVERALSSRRRETLACFASPWVGAPLHAAALDDAPEPVQARIDAALRRVPANLALELALRGLLADGESLVLAAATLASPTLEAAIEPPPGELTFRSGAIAVGPHALALAPDALAAPGPFRVVRPWARFGRHRLSLLDGNPLAALEAHPDKAGNAVDLGGRSVDEWTSALAAALALVERHLPELAVELPPLLREVVPVGYFAERHLSATYREAVGTLYLSLHPEPLTLAEALVHELQHTKLNLASYAVALLVDDGAARHASPLRPDPRPLRGVLLAAHAMVPVAVLLRRLRDSGHARAAERLATVEAGNRDALATLAASADLTDEGRRLVADLVRLAED